ncbi:thymocyte nuclear protein 1-like [Dreissena polymorpha]|uniref:Thymocyte nuclear protein 1 n=1 Tax=Dreissena polymorpha TaxID=45954 RepID=A0A9D4S203_DREPO|nr:thymocyte nuclear protein 1-like [Dreissena polymorpha]KAH3887518.1 hypothetical protein DPMN_011535 [Dreissena polymorpha]
MPTKRKRESSKTSNTFEQESNGVVKEKTRPSSEEEYRHWLMKSEPESRYENGVDVRFGIEDLKSCPDQTACWDGVRNYQARNFMRDKMRKGDEVFFYHSNTKKPGICGICEVVRESYVDHTQFDSKDPHYDRTAKRDNPRWYMVDVKFKRMTRRFVSLAELKVLHAEHKQSGGPLKNLSLFTRARLSVQPISQEEWDYILTLESQEEKECVQK